MRGVLRRPRTGETLVCKDGRTLELGHPLVDLVAGRLLYGAADGSVAQSSLLTDLASVVSAPTIAASQHTLTGAFDEIAGTHTQAQNTAATAVTGASFALATYQGAVLDYILTRGAGVVRKGRLEIAGDSAAPSLSDAASVVGTPGITWSVTVSAGICTVKLAVDNSIATAIRLRYGMRLHLVP